jgi:hypothetical protein
MVSLREEDPIEPGLFGNDPFVKHLIAELRGGFSGRFRLIIRPAVRVNHTTNFHDRFLSLVLLLSACL